MTGEKSEGPCFRMAELARSEGRREEDAVEGMGGGYSGGVNLCTGESSKHPWDVEGVGTNSAVRVSAQKTLAMKRMVYFGRNWSSRISTISEKSNESSMGKISQKTTRQENIRRTL